MRKKTYTEEQLNVVRRYYPSGDWDSILPAFPGKNKADIRAIARKNGIRRERKLTKDLDLRGQTFNMLTAMYPVNDGRVVNWKCKCECGKETTVPIYALIHNQIKSCGCLRHTPAPNAKDFTGQKFGLLTAVERFPRYKNNETYYRCICDCGAEKMVQSGNLSSGHTRTCGGSVHTKTEFDILNYQLDDKEESYSIYRHISPSGKSYIGITKQNPERRFQNGNGYKTQKVFYRAIQKYGWESFKHEILEEGLTEKDAYAKEDYYIRVVYKSFAPSGYNIREGGIHARHYVMPVIQYYKGVPVNFWQGITQAARELKIAADTIKKYSGIENTIEGYYFEQLPEIMPYNIDVELLELDDKTHYRVKDIIEKKAKASVLKRNKACGKPINKYDLDGRYICTFSSIREAMDSITTSDGGGICAAVNPKRQGETAYGFMWKYDHGNHNDINPVKYKMQRAIVKIDKISGEIIEEYKSMAKTAKDLNISMNKVRSACNGKDDLFDDFYLRYK